MANRTVESDVISDITQREKDLTGQVNPVKGGPTAQAQRHVHEKLSDASVVSDIGKGEEAITHNGAPVAGGPAAAAQSQAMKARNEAKNASQSHTGKLDATVISEINAAESELTGQSNPVKGGPTAQAQKHANEPINADTLHDITEGEKAVAGDRVKGGPTATAQSELAKSRRS